MDTNKYLVGSHPYENGYYLNYGDGDYSLESNPPVIPYTNKDIQHTVLEGETLQSIAFRYFGDSGKWYLIAEYNNIINPMTEIVGGVILMIPYYGRNKS